MVRRNIMSAKSQRKSAQSRKGEVVTEETATPGEDGDENMSSISVQSQFATGLLMN